MQIFVLVEDASDDGLYTEHIEVVTGRKIAPCAYRRACAAFEIHRRDAVADKPVERARAIAEIAVSWKRSRNTTQRLNEREPIGLGDRQRPEDERVHHTEDERITADTDRQPTDRHTRQAAIPHKSSPHKPN